MPTKEGSPSPIRALPCWTRTIVSEVPGDRVQVQQRRLHLSDRGEAWAIIVAWSSVVAPTSYRYDKSRSSSSPRRFQRSHLLLGSPRLSRLAWHYRTLPAVLLATLVFLRNRSPTLLLVVHGVLLLLARSETDEEQSQARCCPILPRRTKRCGIRAFRNEHEQCGVVTTHHTRTKLCICSALATARTTKVASRLFVPFRRARFSLLLVVPHCPVQRSN